MTDHRQLKRRFSFEIRIAWIALLGGLPATLLAAGFLFDSIEDPILAAMLITLLAGWWLALSLAARGEVVFHLNTLANILEALREGDYSLRGRRSRDTDALGAVFLEVNQLGETLRQQRVEVQEATALLQKVLGEIDIAVLAFDAAGNVRLANRAGRRLFGRLHGPLPNATKLGITDLLETSGRQILEREFPVGTGRWDIRVTRFRESGLSHQLVVISDLSRALREEERRTWQRLVRVLGHELNNSLAPIKSMAALLRQRVAEAAGEPLDDNLHDDLLASLDVIGERAEALNRFMSSYSRLAKLPQPELRQFDLAELAKRVAGMQQEGRVNLAGEPVQVEADPDLLSQLLINLLKNAREAAGAHGEVTLRWQRSGEDILLDVEDTGPGIAGTENLFTPFFTTKPGGSGIGLALSQQIAEAHGGSLTLVNRKETAGARARFVFPARQKEA